MERILLVRTKHNHVGKTVLRLRFSIWKNETQNSRDDNS
jgi:hypothetical protein